MKVGIEWLILLCGSDIDALVNTVDHEREDLVGFACL